VGSIPTRLTIDSKGLSDIDHSQIHERFTQPPRNPSRLLLVVTDPNNRRDAGILGLRVQGHYQVA
jgi:hypothetical protein